ncbi:MAG: hypothetical protein Q9224_002538 [Gallowayella concinna]
MSPTFFGMKQIQLLSHCGIPVHQQHGSLDDNVPPLHSRRLSQLMSQKGCPSEYIELPGKGHWFKSVMTTQNLLGFYDKILANQSTAKPLPRSFSIVTANPGTMGSKGGIIVDQLTSPGLFGKIKASYDEDARIWRLLTSNIHRLHFSTSAPHELSRSELMIDGNRLKILPDIPLSGQWLVSCSDEWLKTQRHGRRLGGLDAILDTHGRLVVLTPSETLFLATQISRNLFQYFGADTEVIGPDQPSRTSGGNKIVLSLGPFNHPSSAAAQSESLRIVEGNGLVVRDVHGRFTTYSFTQGLGAIFLRPGRGGTLELVIWGFDNLGLHSAARLVPMLTGVGQPDFVIVGKDCSWKGIAGVHALGFFDNSWNTPERSVVF